MEFDMCGVQLFVVCIICVQSVEPELKIPIQFPESSTVGIFGAIAVPLSDRKNVFVSYNFEANYNSPFMASDFYPGFYNRLDTKSSESKALRTRRSMVTRSNFYKIIERKLIAAGYSGHDCLLRAICEAADTPLGMDNGVLGDIFHIILTPSTSESENIPHEFNEAELYGTMGLCEHYSDNCPQSIFDIISVLETY